MLLSQFSAIFDSFRQKIGVFLINQCYDLICALFSVVLSKKKNSIFFANFFAENILKTILKTITSVPDI
jgi:hypothetical protein